MTDILEELKLLIIENPDPEPLPDIVICDDGGWEGKESDCELTEDGDWETGYYLVALCPKCDDGGCVFYEMSPEQDVKWAIWNCNRKLEREQVRLAKRNG